MVDWLDILGISTLLGFKDKEQNVEDYLELIKKDREKYHLDQIIPVKFDYTPSTLAEYIGQENAKYRINTYVKKIKQVKPVHLIISGTRGHGKSTLVYIIAKMLGVEIDTYVGGSFTIENLNDFLQRNSDDRVFRVLFIDEIHGLSREVSEYMLPLLQSFILPDGNQRVKPFVLMGATTNLEILQRNSQPFVDRCDLIELEHYTADDIKQMLKQYNDKLYRANVSNEVYDLLANNTRFNPRTSLSMFDDLIIEEDIYKILKGRQILKDGLTTKDVIVLKHLKEIEKPVGIEVLAVITQQTRESYKDLQEPYLLQMGYISRTARGRIVTEKGKNIIRGLE
jgi:Holliday junction DNA helicase RuvB